MTGTLNQVKDLKIAYIGGGSRGWAWNLMKDLARCSNMTGQVALYDIDYQAAYDNECIGNKIVQDYPDAAHWSYKAYREIAPALASADFVVISILPGTFKEMRSDVHTPEKYGIFQPVGDTIGPGGVIRSLRTVPMFEEIARAIQQNCPNAWVINYTNPMSVCVKTLYDVFPGIKAFGCCHEVFGTQKVLARAVEEILGIKDVARSDIQVNVTGVNHFTWITQASYKGTDLMPVYEAYAKIHAVKAAKVTGDSNWMNKEFECLDLVKFDLFSRFGAIAAAGDRHLAEFCPLSWYTKSPEAVKNWGFGLTSVDWRVNNLKERLQKSEILKTGQEKLALGATGEEGVLQMQSILGLNHMITNVNLPNVGQISNLPLGSVVETNAAFTSDSVKPVMAGKLSDSLLGLIAPIVAVQNLSVKAGLERSLELGFEAFLLDPHVQSLSFKEARSLFDEMIENTKEYLADYFK